MTVATPTRTDEELASTALGRGPGDREALGELLERHSGHLFNFFALQVRNSALAEDLVQEVFMRVIRARERFEPGRPFRPWLWTIAHNLARNARRRRATDSQTRLSRAERLENAAGAAEVFAMAVARAA